MVPITTRIAMTGLAALLVACGASEAELRRARTSGYETDFAVVYSETLAATRDLYPNLVEDARTGVIRTAWHPIRISTGNAEDPAKTSPSGMAPATGGLQTTTASRTTYFIRFVIAVVGGKPWRVRVDGEASLWRVGEIPTPLRGADVPPWLAAREDALRLSIFKRLEPHAVALKYRSSDDKVVAPVVDLSQFAGLPPAAARTMAAVDRAAEERNVTALRESMADAFTWSFGSTPSADVAIATWQADPNALAELAKVFDGGCAPDEAGAEIVCPRAALADGYLGYRAGFADRGGSWKMIYFVAGD